MLLNREKLILIGKHQLRSLAHWSHLQASGKPSLSARDHTSWHSLPGNMLRIHPQWAQQTGIIKTSSPFPNTGHSWNDPETRTRCARSSAADLRNWFCISCNVTRQLQTTKMFYEKSAGKRTAHSYALLSTSISLNADLRDVAASHSLIFMSCQDAAVKLGQSKHIMLIICSSKMLTDGTNIVCASIII